MYKKTMSALIGLAGAVDNNGKTESTDDIVRNALLLMNKEDMSALIHREKFKISPNCEVCPTPCGNTSDYPIEEYEKWTKEQQNCKEKIILELQRIASIKNRSLPEIVYRAISYIGYDLEINSYEKLLEEMKKW